MDAFLLTPDDIKPESFSLWKLGYTLCSTDIKPESLALVHPDMMVGIQAPQVVSIFSNRAGSINMIYPQTLMKRRGTAWLTLRYWIELAQLEPPNPTST